MVATAAMLSDVHGVLPVLDAVLAEPDVAGADLVVVTGDLASGPQPVEVLDRLSGLGDRVVLVRGNADRELVALRRGLPIEIPDEVSPWAAGQLRDDQVELLADLPHPVTIEVDGFGPVLCCHGTPRDDQEVVLVDTRIDRWQEALAGIPDEVRTVVCGHTHMPFVRLVDRRLVVNPGSVGMPYGHPGGSWALLHDGAVTLRRTLVDADAAIAAIVGESAFPGREAWADYFIRGRAGDVEALAAFRPRDGRDSATRLTAGRISR
jgi:putative phosphoesterase